MAASAIRFDDGAGYERAMGRWSRLAGEAFVAWLALPPGLQWLDVGCGNGAFTEVVATRCAPASLDGIDPFDAQLDYARKRPATRDARFRQGDAMALPYADAVFDVATMALVISFVAEPARAVAELARVVRPGGTIAAYAWDEAGGGYPFQLVRSQLRSIGAAPPAPPRGDASRIETMRALWQDAGLEAIGTRTIAVRRVFASFEDLGESARLSASMGGVIAALSPADAGRLEAGLRERLRPDAEGRVALVARANAIKGQLPR